MSFKCPLKDEEMSYVVYRLNCEECSSHFVGEMSKRLMTKTPEHKSAVRTHDTNPHIGSHISVAGHVVGFKKAKVQAQVKSKGLRPVQEARLYGPSALNRSTPPLQLYSPHGLHALDIECKGVLSIEV